MIARLAVVLASCLPAVRSQAGGPEARTWTLSDAHTDSIACLSFSPDGTALASAGRDGTIKLWDLATGRVRRTLEARLSRLSSAVAFSPDGKTLASGSGSDPDAPEPDTGRGSTGGITLWDVATGQRRMTLAVPLGHVLSVKFSQDGEMLAWVTADGAVRLWNLSHRRLVADIRLPAHDYRAAFAPDLKTVAVVGRDYTILLIDVATGRERATLKGHRNEIWSLAFSPDGKTLASGAGEPSNRLRGPDHDYPSEVKLWDLAGELPRERASLSGLTLEIPAIAFSPDSRLVAAGGFGQQVRVWDAGTGSIVADLEASCSMISTIAFSPDGSSLAASGVYQSITVWDTGTWRERVRLVGRIAYCLAYTPDGHTLAAGLSDGTVALWDVAEWRVRTVLQGHTQRVRSLAVSPDGKWLAAGSGDGVISLWDPTTGRRRGTDHYGHSGEVTSLAFSPDGRTLASGGKDTNVRLWDVTSIQQGGALKGHRDEVACVVFAPDGAMLASASHDGTVRLWDVAGRREKAVVQGHTVKVARMREETRIIHGEPVTVSVGIPGETRDLEVPIYALAYSPDGRTLATGDRAMFETGGVSLRDAGSGQERASFRQSRYDVNALVYSPDGRLLVWTGYDTVKISDAVTGRSLAVLNTGSPFPISALVFSDDGKTLASCGYQVVQLWDVEAALQRRAED